MGHGVLRDKAARQQTAGADEIWMMQS